MSLAGCIISIHMNKMDGSSTYSQPLGRMHHARGITSTPTISERQHLILWMGHKSQGTCIPLWQAQGKGSKLASLEILQISRLTKSCKSLTSQNPVNLSRCP